MARKWLCGRFALAALLAAHLGCGNSGARIPTAPKLPPHTPVPSPDVRAYGAHFPHVSISFPDGWARGFPRAAGVVAGGPSLATSATAYDYIFLNQSMPPQLDIGYAGSFSSLGFRAMINGQPWYDARVSCVSQPGYEGVTTLRAPSWSPPDTGTYVIALSLDPDNDYPELDETNNSDTLVVTALTGNLTAFEVDLTQTISGTVVRADVVKVGTPVTIYVRSFCAGVYPSYRMRLDQNGEALLDSTVACAMDPYGFPGNVNPVLVWIAKDPGTHVITLSVDPDGLTRESTRSDNVVTSTLVVTE